MSDHRPNILYFIPHDLGDYLHCYGHASVHSPNLDALAADGLRLTRYFTAAPECTPSRAGMTTGLYTHQNGLMGLCHRGWEFSEDAAPLAQRMAAAGYTTHLFGLQHETAGSPARLGYQHMHSQLDRRAGPVCERLADFLRSNLAQADAPWYASAGFSHVHRPWSEQTSFHPDEVEVPPYLPDNPKVRQDLAHFHQDIQDMDQAIGEVLQALESTGLDRQTIVIFTTDHGSAFPRAKSTFYDPGIRIPFIARWPGALEGGREYDELLSNLDFTPTILEACGIDIPEGLEGRSFWSLLRGESYEPRDAVFGALYYDAFYDPMHCVRTGTHKYIRSFAVTPEDAAGADPEMLARHQPGIWVRADDSDVQNSLTWETMRDQEYPKPPPEELYDLRSDPLEQHNLLAAGADAGQPGVTSAGQFGAGGGAQDGGSRAAAGRNAVSSADQSAGGGPQAD